MFSLIYFSCNCFIFQCLDALESRDLPLIPGIYYSDFQHLNTVLKGACVSHGSFLQLLSSSVIPWDSVKAGGCFLEGFISAGSPCGLRCLVLTHSFTLLLAPQLGSALCCPPPYLLSNIRDSESLCFYPLPHGLMGQSLSSLTPLTSDCRPCEAGSGISLPPLTS